jgi:hypothetical protein
MPNRIEAYTVTGVATGAIPHSGPVRELLEGASDVVVEGAQWLPLDGSGERAAGDLRLQVDDLLLVVSDEPDGVPVHAQWHSIELDAGPYRVFGEMPTMPGFDPGRALARPTGEFVVLRDARIMLIDQEDAGEAGSAQLLVNRYTVDRIAADLMLGFFFPGAKMTITGSSAGEHEAAAADASAASAAAAAATASAATPPTGVPEAPAAIPAESA